MNVKSEHLHGILPVDKPARMSSHDVVQQVRRLTGQRRIGHTGTLDPLATGLLVLCLGRATKVARFVSDMDKTYQAEICLGRTSATYDAEGVDDSVPARDIPKLSKEDLAGLLLEYKGVIKQRVPAYSAVRVEGRRLYESARQGRQVETPERNVEIKDITLEDYRSPYLRITVTCSKGTYVRSLAHNIGERLGCGAYLSQLRRTSVGHLSVGEAVTVEQLADLVRTDGLSAQLMAVERVLRFAAMKVTGEFEPSVITGKEPRPADIAEAEGSFSSGDHVFLKSVAGTALAVGIAGVGSDRIRDINDNDRLFQYVRVLN